MISKLSLFVHPLSSIMVTACQPAQSVPIILVVSVFASHMYVYGNWPPIAAAIAFPVESPKHSTFDNKLTDTDNVSWGWVIVICWKTAQS